MNRVEVLDKLIAVERSSVKLSLAYALVVFTIGLIISTTIYFLSLPPEGSVEAGKLPFEPLSKWLLGIPPLVAAFGTVFPLKDYIVQRKRISYGQILQTAYQSPPVEEEIEKRFWAYIDRAAG